MQPAQPTGPVPAKPGLPPAISPQEQRARDYLAQGRFRKARDEFKVLCKMDRARYLPWLIQANVGLAREMLAKGQVSEAQQVIAYLKTLAPPEQFRALDLEAQGQTGNPEAVLSGFIPLLAAPPAGLSEADQQQMADLVILAFQAVPEGLPGAALLAGDIRAVHQALEALSASQFERALEGLRPISHRSPFRYWKLFLKGLVAFYLGEGARAVRAFDGLPPASVPAKASLAFRYLADPKADWTQLRSPPGTGIEAFCRVVGQPGLGRWLARADQFWLDQKAVSSYEILRENVAWFPANSLDELGVLTDFYYHILTQMPGNVAAAYTSHLQELTARNATKNPTERRGILRALCLYKGQDFNPELLEARWADFLETQQRLTGPDPVLSSRGYAWLGEQLSVVEYPGPFFGSRRPQMFDARGAMAAFERSIQDNPANLEAYLKLCQVYEVLGQHSQHHRLLDAMTRRFPDNKQVFIAAGRGCLARKAFKKGLGYLERAWEVDRLDPALAGLLLIGRHNLAREYYAKGRVDQARQTFAAALPLVIDDTHSLVRSRWVAFCRQGLMEQFYGDPQQAQALLEQARAAAPFPAAFSFGFDMIWKAEAIAPGFPPTWNADCRAALADKPTADRALVLARIFNYWTTLSDTHTFTEEIRFLRKYLKAASSAPYSPQTARQLLEVVGLDQRFLQECLRFSKKMLKADPPAPFFRLFEWASDWHDRQRMGGDPYELRQILAEAVRRGDEATAQKARQYLHTLEHAPIRSPFGLPDPADVDEFGQPYDDDVECAFGGNVEDTPDLPPPAKLFEAFQFLLQNASESELKKMRRELPPGMSAGMFDDLVKMLRQQRGPPPPPTTGPYQPDLF